MASKLTVLTELPSLMKPKSNFYSRLTNLNECFTGKYQIEEHFWINRMSPDQVAANVVYCFACGVCTWQKGASIAFSARNPCWSFEYVVKGVGKISYGGVTREVKAGDLFIHAPGRGFNLKVEEEAPLIKKTVSLFGNAVDYFCNLANLGDSPCIEVDDCERIERIYDDIILLASQGSSYLSEDMGVLSYALVSEVGRMMESQKYPRVLGHAMKYMECNLSSSITLASLSAECRINATTLTRLFREHLDDSPINYLIARRLEQAKHLIHLKGFTFKEIAMKCGYKRESFFSRAFKQKYGISPYAYRRSISSASEPLDQSTLPEL